MTSTKAMSTRINSGPGRMLVAIYGLLGLAATGRSIMQIAQTWPDQHLPYWLSAVAAVVYLVATVALSGAIGALVGNAALAGPAGALAVPSGSRVRLTYRPGEAPILAVKLQELFGLADTPTVNGGRTPVLLHLLSPAGRPVQVTQDLRSFWNSSYFEVRKDPRGRYPKHPWPDDPWTHEPTRSTKRRPG